MQIIDSSEFGLRSARHTLRSLNSSVSITLFPMIHLGEPAFYNAAYEDAFSHDAVLVEGVRSSVTTHVTRSYRWIEGSKQIALIVQPPYPRQSESHAQIIHADLSGEEFEQHWRKVPFHIRWLLYVGAPIYGLYYRWFGTRASLAKGHDLDDLPSRDETLRWTPEYAALGNALGTARDERLLQVVNEYLDVPSAAPRRLAIVYGARHMRAVIRHLTRRNAFHAVDSEWMTIFSLDLDPPTPIDDS